jgi:hypothetical protein
MALALPKAFWPLTIVAGVNDLIDVKVGASTYLATIAPGTYDHPVWYAGEASTSLLGAVQVALQAAVANTWTHAVVAGRVRIGGAAAFELLFSTGANAAASARDVLGYGAVDTSAAASATAANQHQNAWYADDPVADDTGELPAFERAQTVALGGPVKSIEFAKRYGRAVSLAFLQPHKVFTAEEGSTHSNEAIERLLEDGWSRFRWWPDASVETDWADYALDLDSAKALPRDRLARAVALYSLTLKLRKFV